MKSVFSVFGLELYPYTLFMIVGVGVCLGWFSFITVRRERGKEAENVYAIEMLVVAAASALPFSMLFDALFKLGERGEFVFSGATFYGGLLGAVALWIPLLALRKGRKTPIYDRLCDLAFAVPAGHFFGRIGCFFGGCCYGRPTDLPFGVVFPEGSLPYEAYGPVPLHPTQLYEAALLLALFVALCFIPRRHALPVYLVGYGAGRFLLEFLRGDPRGFYGLPLSPAQCVSLPLIAVGIAIFLVRRGKKRGQDSRKFP